jgi:RHS repeat-associated protein
MSKAPKPTDWSSAYTLTYDAWQRLVKVKSGSTTVATYAYDGQNRRVTKTTGTTLRHYYYSSQWQILEERLNTTTSADHQFVWGLMALDNLILRDRGSERFYSLQDVFSCTAIADTAGIVQERYGYNAFGLSRVMDASFNVISASSYDWETRYDNYRFDSESNFYQVRNRYLHPTLGRWLTRDPIGYEGGINLYAFSTNSPVNVVDTSGLLSGEAGLLWSIITGSFTINCCGTLTVTGSASAAIVSTSKIPPCKHFCCPAFNWMISDYLVSKINSKLPYTHTKACPSGKTCETSPTKSKPFTTKLEGSEAIPSQIGAPPNAPLTCNVNFKIKISLQINLQAGYCK